MLRRLRTLLVLGISVVSLPALAAEEEATETPTSNNPSSDAPQPAQVGAAAASVAADTTPVAPPPTTEVKPEEPLEGWHMEVHGYFRAPMALGISSRPNPDQMGQLDANGNKLPDGPSHTQISYGPDRTVDWSYYSFAYTRLQEQDWAEFAVHAKKKHVDAAVGWMGYWLAATGLRNPDAAALPGIAYLTLDTDLDVAGVTPNLAFQMGAWWPHYGYFEKYDTFTLGQFRQVGEELRLTVPLDPDLTVKLTEGFGTGRDGTFRYDVASQSPLYATRVGADLIAWGNLKVTYKRYVDIGLHYNYEWTRDPYLTADASATEGKAYTQAAEAHLSVAGAEANLSLPWAWMGRLWISPSYLSVKNGWALSGGGGTEVMHSQNGMGIATNYMAWTGSPPDSTGTGSMLNLGFLYENKLSNFLDMTSGVHDLRLNVFGLLADASIDLPAGTQITQNKIKQFKYGADLTYQAETWLGLMLRYDTVNYDLDHPGFIFSSLTGRLIIASHFLSSECIYIQYSRYFYGDKMVLKGIWPWNTPLVAGTDVVQGGAYAFQKPDENVIKLQAQIAF
jgi:hypothetical protein